MFLVEFWLSCKYLDEAVAFLVSGKISHYCLELKMRFHILEWRFELTLNSVLQNGTSIRGRKRTMKFLIGKAEQPNSIYGVAPT